jgi:outer membrane protein assembly factor BamA
MYTLFRRALLGALLLSVAFVATAEDRSAEPANVDAAGPDIVQLAIVTPNVPVLKRTPTDAELRSRGTRIGRILVAVDDVFEEPAHLSAPYRIVNQLHISTHEETVVQHLLFRSGDHFDRRVMDETERVLRDQRYLSDASVQVLRYNDDNTVDVVVRVHDVWTLSPGLSFGRKGGENSTKFKFEDTNFFGLGKEVSIARSQDVDRSAWRLGYVDPHVFGSWWRLSAAHSTLSDGADDRFELGRPFYSLDSRWSAAVSAWDTATTQTRYSLGEPSERFDMQERMLTLSGGISSGLQDGWTKRYLFGARYDDHRFSEYEPGSNVVLPDDRRYVYPYVGVQWIEDAYVRTRNLNQIGRTEDLYLGRSLTLTTGFASSAFGSTRDAMILEGTAGAGIELSATQYLTGTLAMKARIEHGEARNAQLDVGGRYYLRQSEHRVLFAATDVTWSSQLDADSQLLLGGDNGLRGYPLRYQAGTSRALVSLEERFYTDWQPLKLANVGAAIFVDGGRMWGEDAFAPAPSGWLADVGLGLRLGSVRSGLGNILHIDLAFPLNRSNDIDSMQLTIETKQSF